MAAIKILIMLEPNVAVFKLLTIKILINNEIKKRKKTSYILHNYTLIINIIFNFLRVKM